MADDGWERADSEEDSGWERPTSSKKKSSVSPGVKQFGKNFIGGLDAALTTAAQTIPFIGSGVAAAAALPFVGPENAEGWRKDLLESGLGLGEVKPVTKEGGELIDMVSRGAEFIKDEAGDAAQKSQNPFTLEPSESYGNKARLASDMVLGAWGAFAPVPGGRAVRKMGNAVETWRDSAVKAQARDLEKAKAKTTNDGWERAETKPTEVSADVSRLHDQSIIDRLKEIDDQVTFREDLGTAHDASIVNRLKTIDEALGAPDEMHTRQLAEMQDAEILQRLKDMDRKLARTPETRVSDETLFVDPQEQVFRGDPTQSDARLALDRQTEAMDRELTHLQGKGTPEGEPFRPLTDVERAERMGEARDLRIQEMETDLRNLSKAITSKGKIGRQRGAINPEVFKQGFEKIKELGGGVRLRARMTPSGLLMQTLDYKGHEIGRIQLDPVQIGTNKWNDDFNQVMDNPEWHNLESSGTDVIPAERGKGYAKEMYRFAAELGNDVQASGVQSQSGRAMWEAFEKEGLSKRGVISPDTAKNPVRPRSPGNKQTGGIIRSQRPQVQAAIKRQQMAKQFKNLGLDEWDTLRDPQLAKELAANSKDITPSFGQRNLVSGINMEVALSNNPVLKFARTIFKDARTEADNFSRRFITDNDRGLTTLWTKMKQPERVKVIESLMEADRRQVELTPELMRNLGFTPEMRKFAETFREADESLLGMQHQMAEQLGMKPTDRRVGHFPGIFMGSYKALVTRKKGKHTEVLGVATADTQAQLKLAIEHMKKEFPDAVITEQPRPSMGTFSHNNKYYSDLFTGWKQVLELLGREDSRFADVQEIVNKALMDANNKLFAFNVHELSKKGVVGNEGNKPWLNKDKNAEDAFKALVRYFEEGSMHHALQVPLKQVKDVMQAPETQHMPNTMKYLTDYVNKVQGRDVNDLGAAINTIIDQPFKFMPHISWDKDGKVRAGVGVGPAVPLRMAGALKNNMSQLYMGWLNWAFTAAQFAQPMQTGLPFMQIAAGRIGASPERVVKSLGKGAAQFIGAFTESVAGKKFNGVDPLMREAFQYARDRGLFEFSEIEKAYQGTQGTLSRNKDRIAEANMKLGEQATRTPMFMSFADLLVDAGMEKRKAFEIAENLTQAAMIDYHQWERPMMYSKLGVLGGFAAGLTTFKHGLASQQVYLAKQGIKPAAGKRSEALLPILYSAGAMMALAGITGMPFYTEFDTVFKAITGHLYGEPKTIREAVLANNPEWVNSGIVSAATNMNWQSKFSSADMIPDNTFKALSPHLEGAYRIGKAGVEMVTEQDTQAVRNFATAATPSGWKGVTENALSKDEQGNLIGKDGKPSIYRTPDEWEVRKWSGMRSQREALEREQTWDARQKERFDTDRRKEIHQDYERRLINDNLDAETQQKLEQEYIARKGDARELLELWKKVAIEKTKTEKERLQGTPNSLRGFNRWEYYNR
jgi:hypothetical protein